MRETTAERAEACRLARQLLEGNECYADKINELWKLGQKIYGEVWKTEFHIFGVIASDIDHLPLRSVRARYSSEGLKRADDELEMIINTYKQEVSDACESVIEIHGKGK